MRGVNMGSWLRKAPPLPTSPAAVIGAGVLLVLSQLALRGWALSGSWFFADDYVLLRQAQDRGVTLDALLEPFNSHLMPAGRLIAALVERSGELNWALAGVLVLGVQACASAAALWMCLAAFGIRWGALAPLSLYLFGAMTVPAFMWWAAALNQVPMQAAFFAAVACWVIYSRSGRRRWLALCVAAVAAGLFAYVKALLIVPLLVALTLCYFTTGSPRSRLLQVWSQYRLAVLSVSLLAAGYLVYYLWRSPHRSKAPGRPDRATSSKS